MKLKTMTLTFQGDPTHVICPGHVDQKTFNKAFKAEGWSSAGYKGKDLQYIYARVKDHPTKPEYFNFKVVSPSHPEAKPFTIVNWD